MSPKNRRQFGEEQFVSLQNPNTIAWIQSLQLVDSPDPIWTAGTPQFAKLFKQLTIELGIQDCQFTPGSLRPGGATMLYGRGLSISQLRFAGRWTAGKSLEHYIHTAGNGHADIKQTQQRNHQQVVKVGCTVFEFGPSQ